MLALEFVIEVDRRNHAVAADTDMILATDIEGMRDVGDQVCGGRLSLVAQEWHQIDADDTATVRQ